MMPYHSRDRAAGKAAAAGGGTPAYARYRQDPHRHVHQRRHALAARHDDAVPEGVPAGRFPAVQRRLSRCGHLARATAASISRLSTLPHVAEMPLHYRCTRMRWPPSCRRGIRLARKVRSAGSRMLAKEPFISLLEASNHDARRAFHAVNGMKPNIRFQHEGRLRGYRRWCGRDWA